MQELAPRTNAELKADFEYALNWSERMFGALKSEALQQRPIALRLPCIFYYGHLPAFTWNQVFRAILNRPSFNSEFDNLFERGIDPPDLGSGQFAALGAKPEWPAVSDISRYKQKVEKELFSVLDNEVIEPFSPLSAALHMVLEHYLMHIETFAYMVHQLPYELKHAITIREARSPARSVVRAARNSVSIPAGTATLGAKRGDIPFGWCNEFNETKVEVAVFEIDRYPVTNTQYMDFVVSGGYSNRHFWSEEGWRWLQSTGRQHPHFWVPNGNEWLFRGMFDLTELDGLAPVWVSFAEAQAFCQWRGKTLPTESQYHRAAYGTDSGAERPVMHPAGNYGLIGFTPTAVDAHPEGASNFGVEDLIGNGWEWTRTEFAPFSGFEPIASYPGYSADFFDNRHFVLKGASPVTPAGLVRRSFRNWFQPHYPYVYAKFRTVQPE